MKNAKFIFLTLFFVFYFFSSTFTFAQTSSDKNTLTNSSVGLSKVIEKIEKFRKNMAQKFAVQKNIFESKSSVGEVKQKSEVGTNYIVKGSSDKLVEPIYKVLAFIFFVLMLVFVKALFFYLLVFFFIFVLLRYLWRRAV